MSHYPPSILKLIKSLSRLPGIGEKTAERLAMHILRAPRSDAERLSSNIIEVKNKIKLCSICFGLSDSDICNICSDRTRTPSILCVVEQPADMVAIEKSGAFTGLYHILEGVLSPMDGIGPDNIRIKELISRIAQGEIKEVVLATSTNVEGEATAAYIAERIENYSIKVTRIASGVPIGGDLKYVDQVTLKKAMETRHAV
ncbi:MAG: recombination protein RecR [Deltaproteobacteria bacterium]|nr:recombination protein RecR [Deltaproteobacteria bacterium]MBW1957183.1 recombination protein RecR [Deltaproteobacteria bacterium]MBW2012387.1 recombination protein RecR [Deltaproteobacteria bacterium]MBW2087837.1 recombination protein RecR [Deltaproteobacteria bacterium]MBW2319526.1 recombination protein RecR [Deltaproteobacteria bacterium]